MNVGNDNALFTNTQVDNSKEDIKDNLPDSQPAKLVSIIVVNRNGMNHLPTLMESLIHSVFYANFEIVFVDNASTDTSIPFVEEQCRGICNLTVIQNKDNLSFSEANNIGAKHANGDLLLFLNNDTQVTDHWLDALMEGWTTSEKPGAFGSKLIYPEMPPDCPNARKIHCIQHAGISFKYVKRENSSFIQPFNSGNGVPEDTDFGCDPIRKAAVTAAALLVSKEAFFAVEGFDERYVYGYEDVDLCLKLHKAGYENYFCPKSMLYHYEFGTQQTDASKQVAERRRNNMLLFQAKWQRYLARELLNDKLNNNRIFAENELTIGFAVTEDTPETSAGDYFTALELGEALQEIGYSIEFYSQRSAGDCYAIDETVDVIISMIDGYDISKIHGNNPGLIKVAWIRNWNNRWCKQPYFNEFDIALVSSNLGVQFVKQHSNVPASLFPIATNYAKFHDGIAFCSTEEDRERFSCDYAFTGSYWNAKRDIIRFLNPAHFDASFKLFGANWDKRPRFAEYWQGFLAYADIPKVYAHTRIIIDDSNHVTKPWGSLNSRVYDALAAGVLVITNNVLGSYDLFDGKLPAFTSKKSFEDLLEYYLENEQERVSLVKALQAKVRDKHTYTIRANELKTILSDYNEDRIIPNTVDILGCMPSTQGKRSWGDYYFSLSMKKELEQFGYKVNIVYRNQWYDRSNSQYRIVLRGKYRYLPDTDSDQLNIMWNISHPADIDLEEYNEYDYIFFASSSMYSKFNKVVSTPSSVLMQCTDPDILSHRETDKKEYQLLFIGNTRGIHRECIAHLDTNKWNLTIYGKGWDCYPEGQYVKGTLLPNEEIGQAYHDAEIVLNDHWSDMRDYGIVSNRIFDALAANAFIVSDYLPEIEELFDGCVATYKNPAELNSVVDYYLNHENERREKADKGRQIVLAKHTFKDRMLVVDKVFQNLKLS